MNLIQINKFSELHDAKNIIFCKTDYILNEFNYINNLDNEVILITGNSDYPITDDLVNIAPKNIKKWFAQNCLSSNKIMEPIPIGIENKNESFRPGHGIGYYDRVDEKEKLLSRNLIFQPSKKYYSNFNVNTNPAYRTNIKNICENSNHIDWEESNLSLSEFFDKILEYEAIICPIGNGIDTHRLWEVLYSNRIPITIRVDNFKIYDLYEKLPIVILDNEKQLYNEEVLNIKLNEVKNKQHNKDIFNFEFWRSKVLSDL